MCEFTMSCGREEITVVPNNSVSAPSATNQENSMTEPKMNETVPQTETALVKNEAEQKSFVAKTKDAVSNFFGDAWIKIKEGGRVLYRMGAKLGNDIVKTFTTREGYASLFSKLGDNAGKILAIGACAMAFQFIAMQYGLLLAVAILATVYVVFNIIAALTSEAPLYQLAGVEAPTVNVPEKAAA